MACSPSGTTCTLLVRPHFLNVRNTKLASSVQSSTSKITFSVISTKFLSCNLTKLNVKHQSTSLFADNFTKEILDYAKKNDADLIVVMKKHDFSLTQLVKGVYSEQFVNHSSIPILSIPVFTNPDMMTHGTYLVGDLPF